VIRPPRNKSGVAQVVGSTTEPHTRIRVGRTVYLVPDDEAINWVLLYVAPADRDHVFRVLQGDETDEWDDD
jgi:hypothetical protein